MSPEQAREFLDSLSPDLKERVKELVRDAMDVASNHDDKWNYCTLIKDLRDLCAPEEVKP